MTIHVFVVEAHNHVLEHIHYILRQRARRNNTQVGWSLLHYDSHPDLACPNVPAKACFLPRQTFLCREVSGRDSSKLVDALDEQQHKNLYEMLDTSIAGIAEWIIPLVVAADLDKVYWIKNDWCNQFSNEEYTFSVGAWDNAQKRSNETSQLEVRTFLDLSDGAMIKTSFFHPYYMDDDSSVQDSELMLKKSLHLVVSDSTRIPQIPNDKDWILDICLDYFYCRNPFVDELICHFGEDLTELLVRSVGSTIFRQECIINEGRVSESKYRNDLCTFQKLSKILLESWIWRMNNDMEKNLRLNVGCIDLVLNAEEKHNLLHLYASPQDAENLWNDILNGILRVYLAGQCQNQKNILDIILNALPNLSLPHNSSHSKTALSDSKVFILEVQKEVENFGKQLRRQIPKTAPLCITVARSSDDGFTPSYVTDTLQDALFRELHSIFCSCLNPDYGANSKCKTRFLKDYGDLEGSSLEGMHSV
jgi:hypothetical protein